MNSPGYEVVPLGISIDASEVTCIAIGAGVTSFCEPGVIEAAANTLRNAADLFVAETAAQNVPTAGGRKRGRATEYARATFLRTLCMVYYRVTNQRPKFRTKSGIRDTKAPVLLFTHNACRLIIEKLEQTPNDGAQSSAVLFKDLMKQWSLIGAMEAEWAMVRKVGQKLYPNQKGLPQSRKGGRRLGELKPTERVPKIFK
jgi:hypothetical protein